MWRTRLRPKLPKATNVIPIVMTTGTDPVGVGLVASLARPGGNVTGMTSVTGELGGKFLGLLKEIVPQLSAVVIPAPATRTTLDLFIKEMESPARALKVQIIRFPVRRPEDYQSIFHVAARERANALVVRLPPGSTPSAQRKQIVELAAKNRLPARSTDQRSGPRMGALYPTDRIRWTDIAVWRFSWTRFLEVQNQPTSLSSSRRSSNWRLI